MSTLFVCVNTHQAEGHKRLYADANGGNVTAELLAVFVADSWNGCSFHSTQFPAHTNSSVSGGHEPTWKTRHFCMNVAETQNFTHAGTDSCLLWVLLNREMKFKSIQQRHKVVQKCRKYANISIILQAGSVVLTMFLQEKCLFVFEFELHRVQPDWFALYEWRTESGCLVAQDTPVPHRLSLFKTAYMHKIQDTKWQGPWPLLRNFQTLFFFFFL